MGNRAWARRALVAAAVGGLVASALLVARPRVLEAYRARDASDDRKTIFVSVASYRDAQCSATVRDAFAKAAHPERVRVGVCEQNSGGADEVCVAGAGFEHHDKVRRVSIPHGEARGPTYARHLAAGLFRDEDFFCQVDSHTRFARGWDAGAIADLRRCPSSKPVLTHYPHEFKHYGTDVARDSVPVLCKSSFNDRGILGFEAVVLAKGSAALRRVPFTAGGWVFAPGAVVREVPFDPNLPGLFVGEEVLWSARAWTSGWDFFTPSTNWAFHYYEREDEPKFWDDVAYKKDQKRSEARARRILEGLAAADDGYGLGTERTIEEYWTFAGVDYARKESRSESKFCGADSAT